MKSNWIPMKPNTTQQTDRSDLMRKIYELIDWYDVNSTRKEDDYVKAHLKLVIHLAENIEDSDDLMFIEKIADTFCDIIKKQREVIETLEDEAKFQLTHTSSQYNHLPSCVASAEGFSNDDQIKAAFFNFITNDSKKKRSSFTANDYILRVQNLWRGFYDAYNAGELPWEMTATIIKENISNGNPLLNAYNHIGELNRYVKMKMAEDNANNRNWANARSALNTFGKAMCGDNYEKTKNENKKPANKDFSKYLFNGNTYGKSRLVLAVVKKYVEDRQPSTFEELEEAFPGSLQGSLGVVKRIEDVSDKYKGIGGVKRYFVDDIISLASGEQVIVCTQFGATNTESFVEHAVNELEYSIEKA